MPLEAKVFIIEDDDGLRESTARSLTLDGHVVVGTASSREEALQAIGHFAELGVQVVTLDGNLGSKDSERDGEVILAAVREHAPDVKTVGYAGHELPGVDVDVAKEGVRESGGVEALNHAITDL